MQEEIRDLANIKTFQMKMKIPKNENPKQYNFKKKELKKFNGMEQIQ